jgi:hypothetical protein
MMRNTTSLILLSFVLMGFSQSTKLEKPAPGTKVRKQILDGLRPSIEKDLKQKVIFQVATIRKYGEWAYIEAQPLTPAGKKIDFKKTHYKSMIEQGVFDGDTLHAVLKLEKSVWKTKAFVIGPTDVAWMAWIDKPVSAPKAVFPPPYGEN